MLGNDVDKSPKDNVKFEICKVVLKHVEGHLGKTTEPPFLCGVGAVDFTNQYHRK